MALEIGIVQIVQWVTYVLPAFTDYVKLFAPIIIVTVSLSGTFFNILPDPGQVYPVPCVKDIEDTLSNRKIILTLTKMSRNMTIRINFVICSKPYVYFYNIVKFIYKIIIKVKGEPERKTSINITQPEVFTIDFERSKNLADNDD
jgi:hypothetical protein